MKCWQEQFSLGENEAKLMRSLIYAMMRSGGTECTPTEVKNSIPLYDLPDIFKVVFNILTIKTSNIPIWRSSSKKKVKTY